MGKTKELAIQLRAESFEQLSYAQDFTKKDAKKQGQELAKQMLDNGNINPAVAMSNIIRLTEVINTLQSEIKKHITEEQTINGVSFKIRQGYAVLDYSDDKEVEMLETQLKQRKDLIKKATKVGKSLTDPNTGEEIKPAPVKSYTKDSIVISY